MKELKNRYTFHSSLLNSYLFLSETFTVILKYFYFKFLSYLNLKNKTYKFFPHNLFRSGQSVEELGTLAHRHIQKLLLLGKWDVIYEFINLSSKRFH